MTYIRMKFKFALLKSTLVPTQSFRRNGAMFTSQFLGPQSCKAELQCQWHDTNCICTIYGYISLVMTLWIKYYLFYTIACGESHIQCNANGEIGTVYTHVS